MPGAEQLMQGLKDSGCPEEAAAMICSLQSRGDYPEMIRQVNCPPAEASGLITPQ